MIPARAASRFEKTAQTHVRERNALRFMFSTFQGKRSVAAHSGARVGKNVAPSRSRSGRASRSRSEVRVVGGPANQAPSKCARRVYLHIIRKNGPGSLTAGKVFYDFFSTRK